MIDSKFKTYYENKKENSNLNLIIDVMCHPKKNEAKLFLCFIDDIMNYYMNRLYNNDVRYPLLYIPMTELWAQEVCIEFITLKISLLYNNITQINLEKEFSKNEITLPIDCSSKKYKKILEKRKYLRAVYNKVKDIKNIPSSNIYTNLIVCKSFKNSIRNNHYIDYFCGNENNLCNKKYAISLADIHIDKLDAPIEENKDDCKIQNLFIFLSKSTNGRFSDTYSFQRPRIERLNKLGAGIQNVFYFYFSTKPYKLQRQLRWKTKNAVDILHEDIKEMQDFISISSQESDYIFGRKNNSINKIIKYDEANIFKELVDEAIESCEYSIQIRNQIAICCDDNSQNIFKNEFRNSIDDIDASYFDIYLENIKEIWNSKILPKIKNFLGNDKGVCIILDFFIPEIYKEHIVSYFETYNINVVIETFKSLKYKYIDGKYLSTNQFNKIVILSYQGHYSGKPYNRYPNSFDPIILNKNQKLLNIINSFAFDPYYSVHKYNYQKILQNILSSDYRKNSIKCSYEILEVPKYKIDDSKDYSTNRHNNYQANYNRYRIVGNKKSFNLIEGEYVIYKENKKYNSCTEQITTIESLCSLLQENKQLFSICQLSIIQKALETFLEKKENDVKNNELYIRKDKRYKLTDEEILSNIELWKILLKRKIEITGSEQVYNDIMTNIPPSEKIHKQSFEHWYDQNNDMILPRSRKMQNELFKYLSIEPPYDKIIRSKKAQKGTQTEQKNAILKTFLCNNLFSRDYNKSFQKLNENIKEMLDINNYDDFVTLIELLKKEISYIEIANIEKI